MLKPLTLTFSLALALCLSGVSRAGDLFHSACVPSEQSVAVAPAPQCAAPTPQCEPKTCHFSMPHINICEKLEGLSCSLKQTGHNMSCGFGDLCKKLKPKPPCYTYEWVLKKKRVHRGCGQPGCETCGGAAPVYPTSQVAPAPQGPVVGPAPQAYGSVQVPATASIGGMISAPAPMTGDEAPPAPEAPRGPTSSLLFSTPSGN
jgi:hypothetical protein